MGRDVLKGGQPRIAVEQADVAQPGEGAGVLDEEGPEIGLRHVLGFPALAVLADDTVEAARSTLTGQHLAPCVNA